MTAVEKDRDEARALIAILRSGIERMNAQHNAHAEDLIATNDKDRLVVRQLAVALREYDQEAWHTDWDYWTSGSAGEDSRAHEMRRKAIEALRLLAWSLL